jgi:hypothetical protein
MVSFQSCRFTNGLINLVVKLSCIPAVLTFSYFQYLIARISKSPQSFIDLWSKLYKDYKLAFNRFNLRDYTPVSVRISVRSDFAARATRFQYGNGNSERISRVQVWEGREIDGKPPQSFPSITIDTGNQSTFIYSQDFNPGQTWVSNLGSRYVYVKLYNADGRTCISKIPF